MFEWPNSYCSRRRSTAFRMRWIKTVAEGMRMYSNSGESSIPLNDVSHLVRFDTEYVQLSGILSLKYSCRTAHRVAINKSTSCHLLLKIRL